MNYKGFRDASKKLSESRQKVEGTFMQLQKEKADRYQSLLSERRKLQNLMHKMPTIRVLESIQNRRTKLEILKPLTSGNKRRALF